MIYYIACTATERLKIGYTKGEPEVRLKQLQTGSASELRLIACHRGTAADERELHDKFSDHRLRGEWFEMCDALLEHLSMVVWLSGAECFESGQSAPSWVRCGLLAMQDGAGKPLPDHLAALL